MCYKNSIVDDRLIVFFVCFIIHQQYGAISLRLITTIRDLVIEDILLTYICVSECSLSSKNDPFDMV